MSIVINENGSNVTIKKVFYKPVNSEYKITSGITNNNGVVSGFSPTDCVSLDKIMPYITKGEWEVQIKFKETQMEDRIIGHCLAYDGATSDIPQGMVFGLVDGKPSLWISSTNNSWDVAQELKAVNSISMNTWYWVRIGWNKTEYYVLLSEDGKTFTKVISTVSLLPINPTQDWQLGSYTTGTNFCHGEIDLNDTYFTANGEIWFDKYKYEIKEIYDDQGNMLFANHPIAKNS